jgi:hypothetical protein
MYDFGAPVAGFQFELTGLTLDGGTGGAAGDAGFQVQTGGSTVLGFSFDGGAVPAGSGLLTVLSFTDVTADASDLSMGTFGALTGSGGEVYASSASGSQDHSGTQDCAGDYYGDAVTDNCGTCDSDASNDCTQDCAGTWGGDAVVDNCDTCDSDSSNDCAADCSGDWGGSLVVERCGFCGGDNTICDSGCGLNVSGPTMWWPDVDGDGIPNGSYIMGCEVGGLNCPVEGIYNGLNGSTCDDTTLLGTNTTGFHIHTVTSNGGVKTGTLAGGIIKHINTCYVADSSNNWECGEDEYANCPDGAIHDCDGNCCVGGYIYVLDAVTEDPCLVVDDCGGCDGGLIIGNGSIGAVCCGDGDCNGDADTCTSNVCECVAGPTPPFPQLPV